MYPFCSRAPPRSLALGAAATRRFTPSPRAGRGRLPMTIDLSGFVGDVLRLPGGFRLPHQIGDERVAFRDQLAAGAPAVRGSNRVLAEQRERNRRIAVGDDRVGQHARIDLPPADGL